MMGVNCILLVSRKFFVLHRGEASCSLKGRRPVTKIENPYLLPTNIIPQSYEIFLHVRLTEFVFSGSECITVDVKSPTREVVLHALDLRVHESVEVQLMDGRIMRAEGMSYDKAKEILILTFPEIISVGKAKINLSFDGSISERMRGFYRTKFVDEGVTHWGAATQFEATDARRAFPCFDQPDMKATFSISIQAPRDLVVLSNMPQAHEEVVHDGTKIVEFAETPLMSTYYLAWVIGDFEFIEGTDANGIPVRVWTTPGKKEWGRFALGCALHTLPFYAMKYGISYPLPKVDMIALPDFEAGAMENWGLVTYRETALLIGPNNDSITGRKRVASTVKHELAHFWKGDLTTMKWWDDLWLNEGFATWLAYYAMDHEFPEWDVWTDFVTDDFGRALQEDSLRSTKPIEVHIENPNEINEAFGAIAYSKGSSVIRMIHSILADELFFRGLNLFMQRHQYANAETADLWRAFEDVSAKPIGQMMRGFTEQPGYPVVSVCMEERSDGSCVLHLTQKRFLSDGGKDERGLLWDVPITVRLENGKTISTVLSAESMPLTIPHPGDGWVKVNPEHTGYYRVAYSEDLQTKLNRGVESGSLPDVDCIGMLSDNIALAQAVDISTTQLLKSFLAYTKKDHHLVWSLMASAIGWIKNIVYQISPDTTTRDSFEALFNAFGIHLFEGVGNRIGWECVEGEPDTAKLLRSAALTALGSFSHLSTVVEAERRFASHISGEQLLAADNRPVVYQICARHGSRETLEALKRLYGATEDHRDKQNILVACGLFVEQECVNGALSFVMSDAVRQQDKYVLFIINGRNYYARRESWEFIKRHWEELNTWYKKTHFAAAFNESAVAGFATETVLRDVEEFFKEHVMEGGDRARARALESIRAKIRWQEKEAASVARAITEKAIV